MLVTLSGIVMLSIPTQPKKALFSMVVMLSGITTFLMVCWSKKALLSIFVTALSLYVAGISSVSSVWVPSIFTP